MPASASAGATRRSADRRIGEQADLTYSYDYLGAGTETLADVGRRQGSFAEILAKAKQPLVIVGQGAARAARTAPRVLGARGADRATAGDGQGGLERL